ncbi:MAG TPA: glycosyltransferase family 2 protein [Steroidobacteraceae bacterium]|jgi:GT2 family glycosyltransferase|nr:glycosyltransferase family 2 protein [Steroidobacteraceae bacterium]
MVTRGLNHGPTVGVVIVNHNGGDRAMRVLAALHRQTYPLHHVVVVDNASIDGSPERVRAAYPRVQVVELGRNTGVAIARNAGLAVVQSKLVLLLDHDVYVERDCIERMVRAWEANAPAVVCPRIRLIPERTVVQADGAALHFLGTQILRHGYERVDRAPGYGGIVDGCIGACMLVDRDTVIEAGGFDELFFFYFEDLEFSMRLRGRGHHIWCEPAALVFHERAAGTPQLSYRGRGAYPPTRAYLTMRNRLTSMLIHYRLRTLLLLLPVLILHEAASLTMAIRMGCPLQWARSWSWQFANFQTIAERRRRSQSRRTVADRDLLVGGTPPLVPGLLQTRTEQRLLSWYSSVVNGYWRLARGWIG